MTLREKIVYCRKKAGLSQEELAERIGVSRQAVSKWELGDATPEIGKLLLLAQTFGVTTDWLLSEDGPAEETYAPPPPEYEARPSGTWVDSVPGAIGRLLRQYGWLFGVRLAVGGGLFFLFGLVGKLMLGSFSTISNNAFNAMGFGNQFSTGGMIWYDEAGRQIAGPAGPVLSAASASDPGSILTTFIMILGLVMFIAGIIIAVSLKPKK